MKRWLMKTEPNEYSFQDLQKDVRTVWDGVKASGALKNMRTMQQGDKVLIYHTGKERAAVGTGSVVRAAYPDPEQQDERNLVVDIAAGESLAKPVKLADIKKSNLFPDWDLVRLPRLSIVPVSEKQWEKVMEWSS